IIINFIGAINNFIETKFDFLALRLQCTLLNQQRVNNNISCSITYSQEQQCLFNTEVENEHSSWSNSSTVTIDLLDFPHSYNNMYCYIITASNGIYTMKVKGVFNAGIVIVINYTQ
ncbi:MAG: hypothetical protein MJE68_28600, partial [Proteobacteria bacterium]|nr:hypothetical protein [Pseudomonadota bacterium]